MGKSRNGRTVFTIRLGDELTGRIDAQRARLRESGCFTAEVVKGTDLADQPTRSYVVRRALEMYLDAAEGSDDGR